MLVIDVVLYRKISLYKFENKCDYQVLFLLPDIDTKLMARSAMSFCVKAAPEFRQHFP